MWLLLLGVLMWIGIHLLPAVSPAARSGLVQRVGLGPYKGIFAVLIVTSVVIIVFGWRGMQPEQVYVPPSWGRHAAFLLVLLTFILFAASRSRTNIKRILRHPQLTGLILWSIGHLLANGDSRSLILFTGLGIWAVLEMIFINRREGPWKKPDPVAAQNDVRTVLIGAVVYAVLFWLHPWFTGVRLLPV